MTEQIIAPFTDAEVAGLNAYQKAGAFHPFTCGAEACRGVLVASREGWHCSGCNYRQYWAWSWMANWSWQRWNQRVTDD